MVQLFICASDGPSAFTALLRLQASFLMAPRILRPRPRFWGQTGKPPLHASPSMTPLDVDACPTSAMTFDAFKTLRTRHRAASRLPSPFRLDLADAIFITSFPNMFLAPSMWAMRIAHGSTRSSTVHQPHASTRPSPPCRQPPCRIHTPTHHEPRNTSLQHFLCFHPRLAICIIKPIETCYAQPKALNTN